jgi:Tfp pilus assembly protein PilO
MSLLAAVVPRSRAAWVLLGGGVLAMAVGAGVVLGPVRNAFALADESIARQEDKLVRNLRMIAPASKDEVVKAYSGFGSAVAKQGSTAEGRAAMLAEIEKEASDSGVALSATKPREPRVEKDFEEHQVGIDVEGNMKSIVRFLYGIESSPQLLRVEKLVLDAKAGGEAGVLRGSLVVSKLVTLQ